MNQFKESYIRHILILKEYVPRIIGPNYPTEIIGLIVMATYKHPIISCGSEHIVLSHDTLRVWSCNLKPFDDETVNRFRLGPTNFSMCDIFRDSEYKSITSVSSGAFHSIALTTSNITYSWGNNMFGQLGLGHNENKHKPQRIVFPEPFASVSCGGYHTIALSTNGTAYSWGSNTFGQIGSGRRNVNMPQEVPLGNIIKTSCGDNYTTALTTSNTLYVWGLNNYGQLGLGHITNQNTPQKLELGGIISVSCGADHTVALTTANDIYVWGRNDSGQLGLETETIHYCSTPQKLVLNELIKSIHCGTINTFALAHSGKIYGWGSDTNGQFGFRYIAYRLKPCEITTTDPIIQVHCSMQHTIVLTNRGNVCIWGRNEIELLNT